MNPGSQLPPRAAARKTQSKPKTGKKSNTKSKGGFRWGRFFFISFFVILLLAAAFIGYLWWETKGALQDISTDNNNGVETVVAPEDSVKVKPTALLLLGLDHRPKLGTMNTDVIMVAALNPKTKSAVVVSIPRDTRVELPGYKTQKANHYYAGFYMNSEQSAKEAKEAAARDGVKKMFGEFFDIPIQYTAVINFDGFSAVVDALGGVEVDVDMDMRYKDSVDGTDINLTKGLQTLNGKQALDFVRYRKSNNGTKASSDFERNKRQAVVLGAVTDKMKSLGGAAKMGAVIDRVGKNMKMDMPAKEIENMMYTYFGISKEDITFIPIEGSWRSPYVYLNEEKLAEAKAALQAKLAE
ncbi:LytR family transcriptional regulator [Paenibacillus sambharensis]|uniref:LytR family transcriptional regulator n=1 Tax=Paenibacillus sambharensis TaxID=1803190 RepID=A0A2W1LQ04_9BACL|nr:LCP family protein [Paenibacillus sambharensis]PZD93911.1 LytR family transcriptional regulator [Paenibacillus sambharensis]